MSYHSLMAHLARPDLLGSLAVCLVAFLYCGAMLWLGIARGEISAKQRTYARLEQPGMFWSTVVIYAIFFVFFVLCFIYVAGIEAGAWP